MYENQNDQTFENSDKGQKYEDSEMTEGSSFQSQTRPDRNEEFNNDRPSDEDITRGIIGENSENQLNQEEYELSRLQSVPNNNDFNSVNDEEEEVEDLDEDEEINLFDDDDDDDDDDAANNPSLYGDELIGMKDSLDPRGDDYRNEER